MDEETDNLKNRIESLSNIPSVMAHAAQTLSSVRTSAMNEQIQRIAELSKMPDLADIEMKTLLDDPGFSELLDYQVRLLEFQADIIDYQSEQIKTQNSIVQQLKTSSEAADKQAKRSDKIAIASLVVAALSLGVAILAFTYPLFIR